MFSTRSKRNLTLFVVAFAGLAVLAAAAWLFLGNRLEFGKPSFTPLGKMHTLGSQSLLKVTFSDTQSGLAKTEILLTQDGKTHSLSTMTYPPGRYRTHTVEVLLDPAKLGLHEGPATLRLSARDSALISNAATREHPVMIDFGPPQIFLLSTQNHVNPGGTCVIAYRLSEPAALTGVLVDQAFFKAYPIMLAGRPSFVCYFAMPMENAGKMVGIRIFARDQGGNQSSATVPYQLMNKTFRSDKMMLSDAFLQQKMPEFQMSHPQLRGKPLLDAFIYVNTLLRADNFKTIQSLCTKTEPRQLWSDTFLRMKNASPMAQFGDHRTYLYGGNSVGESVHMGVDLASTSQAPIEAANSGTVVFAGPLGIYGSTVVLDHGFGLFSLYAHLSSIAVKTAQSVSRGSVIGASGLTGLAGGDHLHFGMIVGGQFVNPQEWWDPHWIKDNVTRKMEVSL